MSSITIDSVTYLLTETNAAVTGFSSPPSNWNLIIPSTVSNLGNTYTVTSINANSLRDNSSLVSITIPNSVTSIGNDAFVFNSNLTSVTIPSSVTSLPYYVFYGCSSLRYIVLKTNFSNINIPSPNTTLVLDYSGIIQNLQFVPKNNIKNIVIGNNITSIGNSAFNKYQNLETVIIGSSVTNIGNNVFDNCIKLNNLQLPQSVINFGTNIFLNSPARFISTSAISFTIPTQLLSNGSYTIINPTKPSNNTSNWVYTSSDTSIATIQGNIITFVTSGTLIVTATLPSGNLYAQIKLYYPLSISNTGTASAFIYTDPQVVNSKLNIIQQQNNTITITSELFTQQELSIINPSNGTNQEKLLNRNNILSNMFELNSQIQSIIVPTSMLYLSEVINTSNIILLNTLMSTESNPAILEINNISESGSVFCLLESSGNKVIFKKTAENSNYLVSITKNPNDKFTVVKNHNNITETSIVDKGYIYTYERLSLVIGNETAYIYGPPIVDNVKYELFETTAVVKGYSSPPNNWNLIIPTTITYNNTSYNVTSIANNAFVNCSSLTSITISEGITSIGDSAFQGCTSLTSITIPSSITSISENTFQGCTGLINIIIKSESILTSFLGQVNNSNTSFTFDYSGSIPDQALYGKSGITSLIIGNQITSIGNSAFQGCTGLTSIIIPSSVTSIGWNIVYGCTGLTSITLNSFLTDLWMALSGFNNSNTSFTFDYSGSIPYQALNGKSGITSVTIGNGITSIGDNAFEGCTDLTSINIASSVTSIGNSVFRGCTGLTSINIPDSVTSIGNRVFGDCTGLTSINFPPSLIYIAANSFEGCTSITSATLSEEITNIVESQFSGLSGLTSVIIPNSVTSIASGAFYGCTGITSLTIPENVISIASGAFYDCTGITSLTIPENVTSIAIGAFYGCSGLTSVTIKSDVNLGDGFRFTNDACANFIFDYSGVIGYYTCGALKCITSVTINGGITSIEDNAFDSCSNIKNVTIPDSVTSIGMFAFVDCYSLTSIIIPNSVTSIGGNEDGGGGCTFQSCSSLTSINFPSSLTAIRRNTFYFCTNLTSVNIPDSVTRIDYFAFFGCSSLTSVTIPDSVTHIGWMAIPFNMSFSIPNQLFSDGSYTIIDIDKPSRHTGNWFYMSSDESIATIQGNKITFLSTGIVIVTAILDPPWQSIYTNSRYELTYPLIISDTLSTFTYADPQIVNDMLAYSKLDKNTSEIIVSSELLTSELQSFMNPQDGTDEEKLLNRNNVISNMSRIIENTVITPVDLIYLSPEIDTSNVENIKLLNTNTSTENNPVISNATNISASDVVFTLLDKPGNTIVFNGKDNFSDYSIVITKNLDNTFKVVKKYQGQITETIENAEEGEVYDYAGLTIVIGSVTAQLYTATITNFTVPSGKTFGDSPFTLVDPSSNSSGAFSYTSSNTSVAIINGNTVTIIGVGTTTITATQAGTNNYSSGDASTTFTVSKGNPTITNFTVPTVKTLGDSLFTLVEPTSNSRGAFTYTSSNPSVATINGRDVTIVGAGTTTITATQVATSNYNLGTATATFTVNNPNPTITNFTVPSGKRVGDSPFSLVDPSSNSSGAFTYTSSNPSVATISGNTVTIVGAGTTTITATQASTSNYNSGTITASLTINVAPIIPICFLSGTPVVTDQGEIAIDKINPAKHTIRGKKIVAITKTVTIEDKIVCIEKDVLAPNIPSQKTFISRNHKLLYNKQMTKAKHLIGKVDGVYNKKYNGEVLYNVLLETYEKMLVNNLIVETLDPENIVAQLYNGTYNTEEVNIMIENINDCAKEYKKVYGKPK